MIEKFCKKHNRMAYYGCYLAVYLLCAWAIFGTYFYYNKSVFWTVDGALWQYPGFRYVRSFWMDFFQNLIQNGTFQWKMWDMSLGEGADVLTLIVSGILFDPFFMLSGFVGEASLEKYYFLVLIAKLGLSGVTFSEYIFYMGGGKKSALLGSIVYVFSGFSLVLMFQPTFLWAVILLPLVMIGVEKALCGKWTIFLPVSVMMISLSLYYWLYMATLFAVIYCLVRYFYIRKTKTIQDFFKTALFVAVQYMLGAFAAGFVLLPSAYGFLHSARTSASSEIVTSLWHYDMAYYKQLLGGMIVQAAEYTGYATHTWSPVLGIVALMLLFTRKKAPVWLKQLMAIMTVMLLIPFAGKVMNGFSYVSNRWVFCWAFGVAVCVAMLAKEFETIRWQEVVGIALFLGLVYYCNPNQYTIRGIAIVGMVLVLMLISSFLNHTGQRSRVQELLYCGALVGTNAVSVFALVCSSSYENVANTDWCRTQEYIESRTPSTSAAQIEDDTLYRIAYPLVSEKHVMQSEMVNQSLFQNYNGVTSYFSMSDAGRTNYYIDAELCTLWSSFNLYGFNDRTVLNALDSVKYYIVPEGMEDTVPYGYSYIKSVNRTDDIVDKIYENDNFLPIGYAYNSYMAEEQYEKLNALEKQEALLNAVVLEEDVDGVEKTTDVNSTVKPIEYQVDELVNMELDGERFVKTEDIKSVIHLTTKDAVNGELYLRFVNLTGFTSITVECGDVVKYFNVKGTSSKYKSPLDTFLCNVGYLDGEQAEITISVFGKVADMGLERLEMYEYPMDGVEQSLQKLKSDSLQNIKAQTNEFSGNITTSVPQVLFFSIPYSAGWSAYVDGEETEVLKANKAYLAIRLAPGEHTVTLKYSTPWIKEGIIMTVAALLTEAAVCTGSWYKRRRYAGVK